MKENKIVVFILVLVITILLVAGMFYQKMFTSRKEEVKNDTPTEIAQIAITPVTKKDHIMGNPDADIVLVEYVDFRCIYCKEFNNTLNRLMEEYGKKGNIAIVFRHFPTIDALDEEANSISIKSAIASECVGLLGGESAFWVFVSEVFNALQENLNEKSLKDIALNLNIEEEDYNKCLESGQFDSKIQQYINDGLNIYEIDPNFGTPYSIIIPKGGKQITLTGSQPFSIIKQIIEVYAFPSSN